MHRSLQSTEGGPPAGEALAIGWDDRYDRLRLIGWWDQDRLTAARVLVVGAGALGNEVLKNLALVGAGQILVIDLDQVEISNLSRSVLFRADHQGRSKAEVAAEMASQLNPDCRIVGWTADVTRDVGLGLVREADVVISCVDNREARLWINRLCWRAGRPWIDGGIQEINGVAKVFSPHQGACYECAMTENDYRLIQLRYSCPLLSREDLQQGKVPTAPTIASIIGGLQVQEALKLLHDKPAACGTALVFNGDANRFYQTQLPVRPECLSHESYQPIVPTGLASRATIHDLISWAARRRPDQELRLELDRDFLVRLDCDACGHSVEPHCPTARVSHRDGICPGCHQPMRPTTLHQVGAEGPWREWSLRALGIPLYDVVRVKGDTGHEYLWLNGDRDECRDRVWT